MKRVLAVSTLIISMLMLSAFGPVNGAEGRKQFEPDVANTEVEQGTAPAAPASNGHIVVIDPGQSCREERSRSVPAPWNRRQRMQSERTETPAA